MDTAKKGKGTRTLVLVAALVVFGLAVTGAIKLATTQKATTKPVTTQKALPGTARIIFLHHSTGECVWNGGVAK